MIARKALPPEHLAWNARWGAPFGRSLYRRTRTGGLLDRTLFTWAPSLRGPFGFQPNNTTREAEYPWAFHATPIAPGMKVLEIGGGLAGFQFVLDRSGCMVVNVDPGMEAHGRGWPCDQAGMDRLNRAFGTHVTLHNCFLDAAPLADDTFDRAFSISVIEHIPEAELPGIMRRAYELLRPGGLFVITLDLFLDLRPFSARESNEFGSNVSVRMLAESAPFELVAGDRSELHGYPEFDADAVLARRETLMVGSYHPALAQLLVLRKPAGER
jgi:SAM-dependent methyltransferase